jgi:hypothetical protein
MPPQWVGPPQVIGPQVWTPAQWVMPPAVTLVDSASGPQPCPQV